MFQLEENPTTLQYLKKTAVKRLVHLGHAGQIYDAFIAYFPKSADDTAFLNQLIAGCQQHEDVFSGAGYQFLKIILSESKAKQMKQIWNRSIDYTYTRGFGRRSFRTKTVFHLHLRKAVGLLEEMIRQEAKGSKLEEYLSGNISSYYGQRIYANLIALEIDNGNQALLERIGQTIYGDATNGTVTQETICGLLMSHDVGAHKMVGDLFLAAKLQEGLRQSVVESIDEGSRDGFLYMLKIILDHDMLRYSSVVRALDTWTGLGVGAEKQNVVKKCIETAYACLTDRKNIQACVDSADSMLIYMGLWATAFDEINDITPLLQKLLSSGERYKKLCALYFLRQTQMPYLQEKLSKDLLNENDEEVLAWAIDNLFADADAYAFYAHNREVIVRGSADKSANTLFNALRPLADRLPRTEKIFKESVFSWANISLSAPTVLAKMMHSVHGCASDEHIDYLANMMDKMSAQYRKFFVKCFINDPNTLTQKQAVVKAMGDKSEDVRKEANEIISKITLSEDDYRSIEDLLAYKSGDLRKNAITVLLRMPTNQLQSCIERLTQSRNENMRLAAIDIVRAMEADNKHKKGIAVSAAMISAMTEATQKEKLHAVKIGQAESTKATQENGFGLYNPAKNYIPPKLLVPSQSSINSFLGIADKQIKDLLLALSKEVHKHKDYEYDAETWGGIKEKVILGSCHWLFPKYGFGKKRGEALLEDLPLAEVWQAFFSTYTPKQLICALFILECMAYTGYGEGFNNTMKDVFSMIPAIDKKFFDNLPYCSTIKNLLQANACSLGKQEKHEMACDVSQYIINKIPAQKFAKPYVYSHFSLAYYLADSTKIKFWLDLLKNSVFDDTSFITYFNIAYHYFVASEYHACHLDIADFGRALSLSLISQDEVFAQLLGRPVSQNCISAATSSHQRYEKAKSWPQLMQCVTVAVEFIVKTEVERGEMTTQVSALAAKVEKCHGINHFVSILLNAEKDTYVRGYIITGEDSTKRNMLSHLLKCLYPLPGEDEQTLKSLLVGKKITEKQLMDAAMYSPQWIDIVEKYLGWEGLRSACWYFHAHINETFSDEKTAIVGRYSPIDPQDFKDGAFDINWFLEAYQTLGSDRFRIVYDSAKYIAAGGLHKRSQLFADAVTGKLDLSELEKQVEATRNKDRLLAYSLIPKNGKKDLLDRYRFIKLFAKQSKQYGAQRQASESRAAKIALENLARNAGYSDANRLMWSMETACLDELRPFFSPQLIEGISVSIHFDEKGCPSLQAQRDEKGLIDIPAKIKSHEYVVEAKAVVKQLKDQHQRARASFEAAMVNADVFTFEEIQGLQLNPVLCPMLDALVFKCNDHFGFMSESNLTDSDGSSYQIGKTDCITIAHPYDLYKEGKWAAYQKLVFARQMIQPFRQVFRELYLPNEDELLSGTLSRRYAGHQVQPKKTLALLKSRGWIANSEEGLQKVHHQQNIVVEILALADWFSPADIENPTIEAVRFCNRKSGEPIKMDTLSPLLFSEAMRDVDLVVGVAHAGGVDPEASMSTIEMRVAIIDGLLPMLKLSNVKLQGSHAFITGALGEYTVHLGSGSVHQMAHGSLNILPIHSQHRGRIFLPFIDEDPKTAEIISKIVLLAEDVKLKDPTILSQIEKKKEV